MKSPEARLVEAVESRRAVLVTGSGLSIMASGNARCASWDGLLQDGAELCTQARWWNANELEEFRLLFAAGKLLKAASIIKQGILRGGGPYEYQTWLSDAFANLPGHDHEIQHALHALTCQILTLNYDRLHELSAPRRLDPITWKDEYHFLRFLRGEESDKLLHLHGFYDDAESIILDDPSYDTLLRRQLVEEFRKALSLTRTMVYIGCGGTLEDPHFSAFRQWSAGICQRTSAPHYRLVRECELEDARKLHADDGITPIVYGQRYEDLTPYLTRLRPQCAQVSVPVAIKPQHPHLTAGPELFGRDQARESLLSAVLSDTSNLVCILGKPGFGKTALASDISRHPRVEALFGPRRFFVRVDGARSLADMAAAIAYAMGIPTNRAIAPKDAVLHALARSPALLIIDNLETAWEPQAQRREVEDWLGQVGAIKSCTLLVTLRGEELPGDLGWALPCGSLQPLDLDNTRAVFLRIAPEHDHDPDLPTLLQLLDGWPLAIVLMAHQARGESSLQPVLRRWEEERTWMLRRGWAMDALTSLDVSLRLSTEGPRMTPRAKRLLQLLGNLPAGVADGDYINIGSSSRAARTLIEVGLASRDESRLRLLPLVRQHVFSIHPAQPDDLIALWSFYFGLCTAEAARVRTTQGAAAVARLAPEALNIDALLTVVPADFPNLTAALTNWTEFAKSTGHGDIALLMSRLLEAPPALPPTEHAQRTFTAGRLAEHRHEFAAAASLYTGALSIFQSAGIVLGEAHCIKGLGNINLALQRHKAALSDYQRALELYRKIGDSLNEANCIQAIGDLALACSELDFAGECYRAAGPIYATIHDEQGQANCILSLGDIALIRNDNDAARPLFQQALSLFQRGGDVQGEANCLLRLGDVAMSVSDYNTATASYARALPLYRRIDSVLGEANILKQLGDIALALANPDSSHALYGQALPLYQQIGDVQGVANTLKRLGDVAFLRGQHDAARDLCRQALDLFKKKHAVLGEANCTQRLGEIELACGNLDAAGSYFDQALTLHRSIGSRLGEANCIAAIGDITCARGDIKTAHGQYLDALKIFEDIGQLYVAGLVLNRLAALRLGEVRQAYVDRAAAAWAAIGRIDLIAQLHAQFPECLPRRQTDS